MSLLRAQHRYKELCDATKVCSQTRGKKSWGNLNRYGYPEKVASFEFDWQYMIRGLIIDKKRGNVLKIDRHKYVKLAYHGFKEMSGRERMAAYNEREIRDSFEEPDYAAIDTLFSLAEAYAFMQLVEEKASVVGEVVVRRKGRRCRLLPTPVSCLDGRTRQPRATRSGPASPTASCTGTCAPPWTCATEMAP